MSRRRLHRPIRDRSCQRRTVLSFMPSSPCRERLFAQIGDKISEDTALARIELQELTLEELDVVCLASRRTSC